MDFFTANGVRLEDLEVLIGIFVHPQYMKQRVSTDQNSIYNIIKDTMGKFTFRRCNALYENETFSALFRHFVSSGTYEQYSKEDPTLSEFKDQYDQIAERRMANK